MSVRALIAATVLVPLDNPATAACHGPGAFDPCAAEAQFGTTYVFTSVHGSVQ